MSHILDRAIRELRAETASDADSAVTRQRIEAGWLQRKARARALRRLSTVAGLALLVGGGALAATMVRRARPDLASPAGSSRLATPHPGGTRPSRQMAGPAAAVLEQAPSAPVAERGAPEATAAPTSHPARASGGPAIIHGKSRHAPAVVTPGPSASDAGIAAYAAAHQAHFVDRDWRRALDLWTHYLAVAPTGPLAPEAHFNRAICLVRLDRREEAAAELAPFAAGQWGGYRQGEASRLLAPPVPSP